MSDGPTQIELAAAAPFALGHIRVSPATLEVATGDRRETLEPRIMQVFVALNRRRGAVISRDELIRDCWDGRVVGDDAITRCIARLRRLAEAEGGFTIETIPRVGYRLSEIASPQAEAAEPAVETPPTRPSSDAAPPPKTETVPEPYTSQRRALAACAVALLLSTASVAVGVWSQEPPDDGVNRVAVLSFTTATGPKDASADALAEEITGVLNENQVQSVSRADTALLRGPNRDRVAETLGADFVLDGSIQKIPTGDGKTVLRISAHLDHAATHTTVWSEQFDQTGSDTTGLQSQVAARVVDEIKAALTAAETGDDAAIAAYLLAQKQARIGGATPTALRRDQMRIVVAKAPNFSRGYSGLAVSDAQLAQFRSGAQADALRAEAGRAAAKALALDPKNGEAFVARFYLVRPWQFGEQEAVIRQGLTVEPDEPTLNSSLGALLEDTGRIDEAVVAQQRAVMLDPLSPRKAACLALLQAVSGSPGRARLTIEQAARMWPANDHVWDAKLTIFLHYGFLRDAEAMLADGAALPADLEPDLLGAYRAYAAALAKPDDQAKQRAKAAIRMALQSHHLGFQPAVEMLVRLGDIEAAYAVMERPYRDEADPDRAMRNDTAVLFRPATAALRQDRRFVPLITRLGLTAYWQRHQPPDFCRREAGAPCPSFRP